MIHKLLTAILKRASVVFVVVHIGLILSVYGLAVLSQHSAVMESNVWYILLAGVLCLYGGMVLAVFFVGWPIFSLVRKVQRFLRWRDWILSELPKILAMIPVLIQAIRKGFSSGVPFSAEDLKANKASEPNGFSHQSPLDPPVDLDSRKKSF